MGGFFTLCQPPITQPPTPLSETIKGRVFFRGGIILTMTGMNTVPIVQVLSTPCCSHGTNYRIILKIYLSTLMGCVKKNLKRAFKILISLKFCNDFENYCNIIYIYY